MMHDNEVLREEVERLRTRNAELEEAASVAKKLQADLEALIENTDDFILFSDAQARPVVFNENYARVMKEMLGIEMKPGLQPHALLEDEAQRAFWDGLHRRVLAGEKFKAEFAYPRGEELLTFEVAYNPVFAEGKVVGFSEYTRDVTERKRAEELLIASQQRSEHDYRLLLDKMLDAVVIQDVIYDDEGRAVDYRISEVNPAFERITGFTRDQAIGHTIRELIPSVSDEVFAKVQQVAESGEPVRLEGFVEELGLHLDMHALRPNPDQLVCIFQDITNRKELEEQRQRADRMQSVGFLAGGIAHDFNNILTSLLGSVELARVDLAPASEAAKMLAEAVKACERASALTKQLLTFARGGQPVKALCSLAEQLEGWSSFALLGSNVRCELDVAEDLWPTEIDIGQISQVVHNLLINAQQAMPEGGVVQLRARNVRVPTHDRASLLSAELPNSALEPGRHVCLCVRDSGAGIAPELLPQIFDPYFTTKQGGSGLGLATCYAIVRSHHGTIIASSQLGEGTLFEVLLPAIEGELPAKEPAARELPSGAGRLLFMDDDSGIRAVAESMLEHLGYEVDLVENGQEAIEAYGRAMAMGNPYRAVILDLTVPGGLGGKEAIAGLHAIDSEVCAIVSSGYCSDPVMAHYQDYGFDGMVAKPYQLDSLAEVLERVLAAPAKSAG